MMFVVRINWFGTLLVGVTWSVGLSLIVLTALGSQWISFGLLSANQIWFTYTFLLSIEVSKVSDSPKKIHKENTPTKNKIRFMYVFLWK